MPLYVDDLAAYPDLAPEGPPIKGCHLLADTRDELHTAARHLHVPRTWFREPDGPTGVRWHYPLGPQHRTRAVRDLGALQLDRAALAELLRTRLRDEAPPARDILDWHDSRHWDPTGDQPCTLCDKPTPLRAHNGEAAHKTCAEAWRADHPGETRFVSDAPTRSTTDHA
ncbi:DUF4031 domain-containing protein [Streptomyces sp. NPDC049879]|uniref:DUF4031 domain-containing protein n=1 Tax=Streptomyces sp. NPDC049879 TaxID=3365598 RepID=UPI00378E06F8